ncbi:MAG: hypothetical protein M3Q10_09700 [Chloroflexota bacterium]|nr:hypothetical protein [Chloroflexota bacterium]
MIDIEKPEIVRDDGAVKVLRHQANRAVPSVDPGEDELSGASAVLAR